MPCNIVPWAQLRERSARLGCKKSYGSTRRFYRLKRFGPAFHPLVPIGREVPTIAGSIDNLFISRAGYLVTVETKLWRNPEAKREVVAQLIDYVTALSQLTYDALDALVMEYLRKYEDGAASSLQEWVETRLEPVMRAFNDASRGI